jgi:hypothetical protein
VKTLLKLLVVAIVLNALARSGMAASRYYQLKDAAQQVILFGGSLGTTQLHDEILSKATELGLTVEPANVMVSRDGLRTFAQASYTESIELFPNYLYPYTFTFDVETFGVTNPAADGMAPR